jgi:hypothetical protein
MEMSGLRLAREAVAITVEVVNVCSYDRDRSRVLRAVTCATLAVVVRRVRIEAGALVVGIAPGVAASASPASTTRADDPGQSDDTCRGEKS